MPKEGTKQTYKGVTGIFTYANNYGCRNCVFDKVTSEICPLNCAGGIFVVPPAEPAYRTDFQVGDPVFSFSYGNGKVVCVEKNISYPVRVKYNKLNIHLCYTNKGKISLSDITPSLFHGHDLEGTQNFPLKTPDPVPIQTCDKLKDELIDYINKFFE